MRVTARQITNSYVFNMNKNYGQVADQMDKLQTGRGYTRLSQNTSEGKKALKVRTALYRNEQYIKNAKAANEQIQAAEQGLTSINDQLQTVKALAEKALNGTNTDETSRKIFQSTLEEIKSGICDGLNVQYLDKYVLGGTNGNKPFTVSADGALMLNGTKASEISLQDGKYVDAGGNQVMMSNETYVDVGLGLKLNGDTFDEKSVFKMSFSGLEWTGFGTSDITYKDADGNDVTETVSNNVFDILTEMQSALDNNNTQKLGALSDKLNKQYNNVLTGISTLGTRSAYLESIQTKLGDTDATLSISAKEHEGINDATEITKMQEYNYAWLLTLKFGSQILPQSLMDYIK